MAERLVLVIEGRRVDALNLTLERDLTAVAGSLRAAVHLREGAWVRPGATLTLLADTRILFEGNVDGVTGRSDPAGAQLEVFGRDLPARLVDGAATASPSAWGATTLLSIAEDLARPFGVAVLDRAQAATRTLPGFALEPGETAFLALDRAARRFGVLAHADEFGALVLATPGTTPSRGRIQSGPEGTVEAFHWRNDHTQRFRRYRVLAQQRNAFEGLVPAAIPAAPMGLAEDPDVRLERERVVVASETMDQAECERLAAWHAAVARARSSTLEVQVPSWRVRPGGDLWALNTLVRVTLPEVGFSEQLLISALRFEQGPGDRVSIRLIRRDALLVEPAFEEEAAGLAGLLS